MCSYDEDYGNNHNYVGVEVSSGRGKRGVERLRERGVPTITGGSLIGGIEILTREG